ncbi:MAG: hypothetical protein ACKO96_41600, partial [Flammeovirgaceae bacterium]
PCTEMLTPGKDCLSSADITFPVNCFCAKSHWSDENNIMKINNIDLNIALVYVKFCYEIVMTISFF